MPTFVYEAMDGQGKEVKAEIEAQNEADAADKIRALNFFPTKVLPKGGKAKGGSAPDPANMGRPQAVARKRGGFSLSFKVNQKQLTEFTRQFATLLDAG